MSLPRAVLTRVCVCVQVCEDLKIASQNDTAKLAEAKQLVYLKVGVLGLEMGGNRKAVVGLGLGGYPRSGKVVNGNPIPSADGVRCTAPSQPRLLMSYFPFPMGILVPFFPTRALPQGFTDGVMTVGPYAGRKVSEAKPIIKEEMIASGKSGVGAWRLGVGGWGLGLGVGGRGQPWRPSNRNGAGGELRSGRRTDASRSARGVIAGGLLGGRRSQWGLRAALPVASCGEVWEVGRVGTPPSPLGRLVTRHPSSVLSDAAAFRLQQATSCSPHVHAAHLAFPSRLSIAAYNLLWHMWFPFARRRHAVLGARAHRHEPQRGRVRGGADGPVVGV